MNGNVFVLILAMALVTYIPRALPAVLVDRMRFAPRIEKFLRLIPYTALAALVFPGVFTVDPARLEIGLAGALTAGLLAWRRASVIVCVLAAIGVDMLLYLFF